MSWEIMFLILLGLLFFFFAIGQKIAFALGMASIIAFYIIGNPDGLQMIGLAIWKSLNLFELAAIPLFIVMGNIVVSCNLSTRFYRGATVWFGRIQGGFLQTNIIACAIFAAISGSSVATAASIGSVAYPELDKRGYNKSINLGSLAAGGALGLLIPPSTTFLIYGAITGTSAAKLFIAGIIPGIVAVLFFMAYIAIHTKINPSLVPEMPGKASWAEKRHALIDMFPFLFLMTAIMGSIYLGWATPSESAGLSVVLSVIFAIAYKEFTFKRLIQAGSQAIIANGMVFFIIIGAQIFSSFISLSGIGRGLVKWFSGIDLHPVVFFIFIVGYPG